MKFNQVRTRYDLARMLNVPQSYLTYILYVADFNSFYSSFEIPKKDGSTRQIFAPNSQLKVIQKKIAAKLCAYQKQKDKKLNVSHAFQKGKSIFTNAKIHRHKKYVLNMDIEDFFGSFHYGRVHGFFMKNEDFKLPYQIASILSRLVCYQGHLPQGAPTSPVITNLISRILDFRILKITRKYKVDYTRYADDLTFSTNDHHFLENIDKFINSISNELNCSGFTVNTSKTHLRFHTSRQEVTGLVVNKKINVPREFYKKTRAMAYTLYKNDEFLIDGKAASINQLEGNLSFIDQVSKNNNKHNPHQQMSAKEEEYRKFLAYKLFFGNKLPTIVTEGKTDIHYLKAALKSLYKEYPTLVTKSDNNFNFKVSFLNRTSRISYFLGIKIDGGDSMKRILDYYGSPSANAKTSQHHRGENTPKYIKYFKNISNHKPLNPVILIFDNELNNKHKKPLRSFLNKLQFDNEARKALSESGETHLMENLYLLTTPLTSKEKDSESEIEDLFSQETLTHKINGKTFSRSGGDPTKFYGKEAFSKYVAQNYNKIDFSRFKPLLDKMAADILRY